MVRHTRQGRQPRPAAIGEGRLKDHAVAPFSLGLLQRLVGTLDRSVRAASCKALLADKVVGREPLAQMQKIIETENTDLFDVLA